MPAKIDIDALLALGRPLIRICNRYEYDTERTGIDIDQQVDDALLALARREPLEQITGHISLEHPAGWRLVAELRRLHANHVSA